MISTRYPLPPDLPPDSKPGGIPVYPGSLVNTCQWLAAELIRKGVPIYREITVNRYGRHTKETLIYRDKRYMDGSPIPLNRLILEQVICPDYKISFREFTHHTNKWKSVYFPRGMARHFIKVYKDSFPCEFKHTGRAKRGRSSKKGALALMSCEESQPAHRDGFTGRVLPVLRSAFRFTFVFSEGTGGTKGTALCGAACGGSLAFSSEGTKGTKPADRHGFTGRVLPVLRSAFRLTLVFSEGTGGTKGTALCGAACGGSLAFSGEGTKGTKPTHRHGVTGRTLPMLRSAFRFTFVFSEGTGGTKGTALCGAACGGSLAFSSEGTKGTNPAHRHRFTGRLTALARSVHAEKTTTSNGNPAPRKLCGFFVPAVLASGLLTRHQGHGTTPVSRIGGQRLTRRNKPKVRLGANKPGRFEAVVDAVARLLFPLGRGFGFDPIDYGATPL